MNTRTLLLLMVMISGFLFGCSSSTEKGITGKWNMHKVIQSGTDVTQEHNPKNDRFIAFSPTGTFKTGGSPTGENTGKYTHDTVSSHLFLDSDVGENDDSHWYVKLSGDSMLWQGVGTEWAEDFKLVFHRE